MAKKGEISIFDEQKQSKPSSRSLIDQLADKEVRDAGIEFLEYLSGLRSNPSWYATNSFSFSYKGKRVGLLRIDLNYRGGGDRLEIRLYAPVLTVLEQCLNEKSGDEKSLYCDAVVRCGNCGQDCAPGKTVTAGGITLSGICRHLGAGNRFGFYYTNPIHKHLGAIKDIIEIRRQTIAEGRA